MSTLWTSADAEAATLGRATQEFSANGLSIDTRTIAPGDLFVALKGDNRDGHEFVRAALDRKAAAALVARQPQNVSDDESLLFVANAQRGLEDMARAARMRSHAKIVAVTGSAGKTTTKEMLRLAFGALGETHASAASYNNHWGVPLSLASLPSEAKFGVFEIGMNHFGEIRTLSSFVRPHVALITTIAPAHLEFFGSCEAIADAKSEIFEHLMPSGAALIPADSEHANRLAARAKQCGATRILRFGETGSDAKLISLEENGSGSQIRAEILGRNYSFAIGAPGKHMAINALGALLAIAAVDGDVAKAAAALGNFSALKGRGARFMIALESGSAEIIDESYNANPSSMAASFKLLGAAEGARRIAILGDMLEMGENAPAHHADLAQGLADAHADLVYLCGPNMHALWKALPQSRRGAYAATSADLAPQIEIRAGDVVLVKGSFGSRMALIVDALKAQGTK
ncbi:MAG TPA: UDP-N-acetylmuramoylalanyl-D-glutamyl-2,6-diaminopimelate--D-alanyl-D-alanine ligase [Rhizomicrobium sp.]|jgi:UDP-N-acetylmuramoyl-tripeptide--D-alanyl-D-alanine ligase|nr:UDP-N-acetylmuramoylalanyl-D-glutamyl-2,6-diaminopimelate--D-alanyl-D-alanine ligase [Rhizomicrobium sp.]